MYRHAPFDTTQEMRMLVVFFDDMRGSTLVKDLLAEQSDEKRSVM